ncbi:metal-binding hypothetical protein [Caballeronia calidae]|uniref:Metal-binding integral membrane protein n=1 Tax=Caballeronia calidae TaxID=1777139 RepID=A0A157ZLG2_9BURK|nr:DUF2182 domain-containing protein [Caballeronia calidae]SAK46348.1 metal-binding hypothetical protein [Caballeronia calidae]
MNALTAIIEKEAAHVTRRRFFFAAALVFMASVAITYALHRSMSSMNEIPMPGGWMLSPTFTPMCGRTWLRAAASFIGMWIAMMTAMMLPSFAPFLWRYRAMLERAGSTRVTRRSLIMATAYFGVWTALGIAVFALGTLFTEVTMRAASIARCVPLASGGVLLLAGAYQRSNWHGHLLACCRSVAEPHIAAWRDGMCHGLHCIACCAGLTAALLVFGVMEPHTMALVTLAITAERLLPSGMHVGRVIGIVLVLLGCMAIVAAAMVR